MTALSALVGVILLSTSGPTSPSSSLQQLFQEGDYSQVEAQALTLMEAVPAGQLGDVLYLLGLARFRLGKTSEALQAFDAAGQSEPVPPRAAWQYNRAACLYKLGRFEEAEISFGEAAADAEFRTVAYVQAGFAALEGGAQERARTWAHRAGAAASEAERPLVDELLEAFEPTEPPAHALYREGLSAFDSQQYSEARDKFLEAHQADPSKGRALLMAGASAYQMGDVRNAWIDIQTSRHLALSSREQEIAQQYLELLSFGLRSAGTGWIFQGAAALGYDTNVLQAGTAGRDLLRGQSQSLFGEAFVGIVYRQRVSSRWFSVFSYSGEQRAYTETAAEDYSLQQHRLIGSLETYGAEHWRLGVRAIGDVSFTGLTAFRGLQATGGGSLWMAFDRNAWSSTGLELGYLRKQGLGTEFSYLTGDRIDGTLTQTFRLKAGTELLGWYRFREDHIGQLVQETQVPLRELCRGCTFEDVIPFSFRSHTLGLVAKKRWTRWLETALEGSFEWRGYLEDSYVLATVPLSRVGRELNRRRREDWRLAIAPEVGVALSRALTLTARWDVIVNRSNIDTRLVQSSACTAPGFECHRLDYGNQNYERHVVTVAAELRW